MTEMNMPIRKNHVVFLISKEPNNYEDREEVEVGYVAWWEFVPDISGYKNRGYGSVELGTDVSVVSGFQGHPMLKDVNKDQWHSAGNVYQVASLPDDQAEVLLKGQAGDKTEPIAWSRTAQKGSMFLYIIGASKRF